MSEDPTTRDTLAAVERFDEAFARHDVDEALARLVDPPRGVPGLVDLPEDRDELG